MSLHRQVQFLKSNKLNPECSHLKSEHDRVVEAAKEQNNLFHST